MNAAPGSNEARALQQRIKTAYDEVRAFVGNRGNDRLRAQWKEWDERFRLIFEQTKQRPEVAISFVGGTGAGKSTLLNALIGARVLPVSNMRACTAAICEVAFDDGPYSARIEFIPRDAWTREVDLLLADLRDTQQQSADDVNGTEPIQMSRAVRDKLWTVYRSAENADPSRFNPFALEEPAEITNALDAGYTEYESTDLKEFRKFVGSFLDSKDRYWPIVKSVSIQGPFDALRDGAKIIDLPGINDPNEAREEVTKKHLKSCRFVWMVFNIKRALTRDTISLMQSEDFLRQIVMDGRADSLTLVGTAADDVDPETGIEEFQLSEDAALIEVVSARNVSVREVVRHQLDDLAHRLGAMAREQQSSVAKLADRLKSSKIFTVSAREFLRLSGLANTTPAGFENVEQTELPALINHMRQICSGYGVTAHCKGLERQLQILFAEIKREVQSQQAVLKSRAEISQRGREEMRAAVEAAQTFLERDLEDSHERLVQALESDQALLAERVKRAVDRARHDLDQTAGRWSRMHWATLRAVCRRGGAYKGTTGQNDLPAELSKPILDGIAFAWSEFFGERLSQTLEKWTNSLLRHAETYRGRLIRSLSTASDVSESLAKSLDRVLETTDKVLQELLAQTKGKMETRIQDEQRTLYEAIPVQVKANMQGAFEIASEECGTGMKQRMVAILAQHAHKVAQVMFDDARDALLNGVRSLNDWLAREFDSMIETVRRNAKLAAENIAVSGQEMSKATVEHELNVLSEFATLIGKLDATRS